jgi:hypothetical protein
MEPQRGLDNIAARRKPLDKFHLDHFITLKASV